MWQSKCTCGSCDVEKVHAAVARSTFGSEYIKNTSCSDHLLTIRVTLMSKEWTPLWREAHVEVKMYKAHHARTAFGSCDVEKVHAAVAQSTFGSQTCQRLVFLAYFTVSDVVLLA